MLSVPTLGAAQEPPPAAGDRGVALGGSGRGVPKLHSLWKLRQKRLADGDAERADEVLAKLDVARREAGARRLDPFGVALLREATRAADDGDFTTAERRVGQATLLAPGLPEIHDTEGRVALARSSASVHVWVGKALDAFKARLTDFQRRMLMFSDGVLTAIVLMVLLGGVFVGSQLVRYSLNLYHDLGEAFPVVMKFLLIAAGVLLLAVPMFFGFGPLLFYFPLAVLLWSYQRRTERLLTVAFCLAIGAAPWVLRLGDRLTEAGTGVAQAIHALELNPTDPRAMVQIERAVADAPEDWQAQAALGLALKRRGQLDEALAALTLALKRAPDGAETGGIQNNLGNVHFAAGRAGPAEAAYQASARSDAQAPEPLFNLSRLYLRLGRRADAKARLAEASALDGQRVAGWAEDDDDNLNRHVVDLALPEVSLTTRALSDLFSPTPFAERAWVALAGPLPEMSAPVAALVTLVLLGVLLGARGRLRLHWPCQRCGRGVPRRVDEGPGERVQCEQCDNLFVKSVPMDQRVRFEKESAVARFMGIKTWSGRLAGALLPGFLAMLVGRPLRGAAVFAVVSALALRIIFPSGLLYEPISLPPASSTGAWLTVALVAGLWLWSAIAAMRYRAEAL